MICRSCKSSKLNLIVDLGFAPPSNAFLKEENLEKNEIYFPLKVYVCSKCWLVQTQDVVDHKLLFNCNYPYFSSYSKTFLNHCKTYCEMVVKRFNLSKSSNLLEIASNDGYLQDQFSLNGLNLTGIEPTDSAANIAISKGHKVIKQFFGTKLANKLKSKSGLFDLIVANNVFAHVPDINDFMKGIKICLSPSGVATIENPSVINLINKNQYDTIYHEHFSYLSLTSVEFIANKNQMEVFDVEKIPVHGGSIRFFLKHKKSKQNSRTKKLQNFKSNEMVKGVKNLNMYKHFGIKCIKNKNKFMKFLYNSVSTGKKIVAYGAAAKGNTFLNYCGVSSDLIEFIVDKNPKKVGMYAPGSHIPILEEKNLKKTKPHFIIILPWNLKDEIASQLSYVKKWGAKFVVGIPKLEIF